MEQITRWKYQGILLSFLSDCNGGYRDSKKVGIRDYCLNLKERMKTCKNVLIYIAMSFKMKKYFHIDLIININYFILKKIFNYQNCSM